MAYRCLVVVCLLVGCGADDSGTGRDPALPDSAAPAQLKIDHPSSDFGTVGVSCRNGAPVVFAVTNLGGAASGALEVAVTGPFAVTSDECGGKPLGPMQSCTVSVQLQPQVQGAQMGMLSVQASPGGLLLATLTGAGAYVDVSVDPSTANYGDVMIGTTSASRVFRAEATPTVTREVTLGGADFVLVRDECGGRNVPSPTSDPRFCEMEVAFKPLSIGLKSGSLIVKPLTGCSAATVTVSLTGNGI